MLKTMPTLGPMLIATGLAAWLGWGTPAFAAKARVEVTGQTECFDEGGGVIACATSGQERERQAGVRRRRRASVTAAMARCGTP